MVKRTEQVIKKYFLLTSVLFLAGCANQLPPGGGEVDRIPPEIIFSYPDNETTNFEDDFIEFDFSEYVDKRSFKEALFISPALDKQPEISWSGTSVEISFPEGLKDSVTYVVTIGTDVVDVNNKNRMANSFSFSFATGDQIDKRSVSGKVYGKEKEGALIFAYKFVDDTTKYLNRKPDYISQIGKDGDYKLKGIAESTYRVFAVKDQFRDLLYQADQDWIGIPSKNISLLGNDSSYAGLDFWLMKVDTLQPRLLTSVMTDRNHIVVTLSEECDSASYSKNNFSLIDSTSNKIIPFGYSYQSKSKKEEFVLGLTDSLKAENIYYLRAERLKDLIGNVFEDELTSIAVSEKVDTSFAKIYKTNPNRNSSIDFIKPEIEIFIDDVIADRNIVNAIQFADTSKNKVSFDLEFIDDATLKIKPLKDLKPETVYDVKIDLSKIKDAAGNKVDSIYQLRFQTITGVEFTGISGKLTTTNPDVVLVLQNPKDEKKFYTAIPDKTSTYSFTRVEPGTYTLWLYSDSDSSKTFSKGYPEPFQYSEEFKIVADTIKLRPRWSVTDNNIEFE
ncbi:MAG: Ig-like domain-containing protein [Ignavibacteriales bacterium]|nr:Ig-like domain-containing protein [Ignavibacteriales bacterium]